MKSNYQIKLDRFQEGIKREKARYYCRNEVADYNLKRRYGITLAEKESLFREQNECCAICMKKFPHVMMPYVDHDHKTKKVRGLLCNTCNAGLGFFNDKIENLQKAISYLQKPGMITL